MLDEVLISPARLPGEPLLGPLGLLFINPGEAETAARLTRPWRWQHHFFFNSRLFVAPAPADDLVSFWAGPAVGAPMAVMALEKLGALGAKRVVVFGWCGSLVPALRIGELLAPTWALSEEGCSRHYPHEGRPRSAAVLRRALCRHLTPVAEGPVWTTDAPYRETRAKVKSCQEQGLVAVDMEFSALCAAAAFRNMELAAVMLTSDELWGEEWRPGFRTAAFRKRSRQVIETLFQFHPGEGRPL